MSAFEVYLLIVVVPGIGNCICPTTSQMYQIAGISYLTQNKEYKQLPSNLANALNKYLKEEK